MPRINILTSFKTNIFSRQYPGNLDPEFAFFENGSPEEEYDMVVVYEGLKEAQSVRCRSGNLLFISGEPPTSSVYTKEFLAYFNYVISSHQHSQHPNHISTHQALPWHFGFDLSTYGYNYNFESLVNLEPDGKTRKISIIASNKKMMPGHNKRLKFVEKLREKFGSAIDFFGKGTNPVNDKAEAILPYYMTICIENSAINNYWTEKIADAYIGYTLPIYNGCLNIDEFFPSDSMIKISLDDSKENMMKIESLIDNCELIYKEKMPSLLEARKRLLYQHNIYPFLIDFYKKRMQSAAASYSKVLIKPNHETNGFELSMSILRMKRFAQKWFV